MTARRLRWPARLPAVGGALLLTWFLVLVWSPAPAKAQDVPPAEEVTPLPEGTVQTEWGPLTEADRDFLRRVRYANLWEVPAGEMAMEKGTTEYIREIGELIRDQHLELDQATRDTAAQLGVQLPNEPHPDNQLLLNDIAAAEGEEFDFLFSQHLREAHGVVYPLIAYARTGTKNDLIREFASVGEEFVGNHLGYLEGSGLIEWDKIPPAPEPLATESRFLGTQPAGVHPILVWVVLAAAAVGGGVQMVRTLRPQ